VLTVGLAVVVLAVVAVGLRATGGSNRSGDVVEVPARRDAAPPTSDPSGANPSTSVPSRSPFTTAPATGRGTSTTLPRVDSQTPRIKVTDADGRFDITVPRTWLNLPTALADQNQWQPSEQQPNGTFTQTPFLFVVRWAPSVGCPLDLCAAQVVGRLKQTYSGLTPTITPERIGSQPAMRIEASTADQRIVVWVVVEGDRLWLPQLRGPPDGFDAVLAVAEAVVATMSFG